MWRKPKEKVLYDWFTSGWCTEGSSVEELENFITDHVSGVAELKYETTLPELQDEHLHVSLHSSNFHPLSNNYVLLP